MNRNRTGRAVALAALALAAHAGTARAQQLPPAREIVERYVQAIGGREALARLGSRHTVGEMSAAGVTVQFEVFSARPNKRVLVMNVNGRTTTSGYDGQVAWRISPTAGPRRITDGFELKQALDSAEFDDNLDPVSHTTSMETVGERTVDGRACWDVKMVSTHGIERTRCFDKETGLLVATRFTQMSPAGEIPTESVVSDYREFDGVKMPTRMLGNMMGQQLVFTVRTVSHEPIPAARFELPAEVKALPR